MRIASMGNWTKLSDSTGLWISIRQPPSAPEIGDPTGNPKIQMDTWSFTKPCGLNFLLLWQLFLMKLFHKLSIFQMFLKRLRFKTPMAFESALRKTGRPLPLALLFWALPSLAPVWALVVRSLRALGIAAGSSTWPRQATAPGTTSHLHHYIYFNFLCVLYTKGSWYDHPCIVMYRNHPTSSQIVWSFWMGRGHHELMVEQPDAWCWHPHPAWPKTTPGLSGPATAIPLPAY